jgi:hypothetical protein
MDEAAEPWELYRDKVDLFVAGLDDDTRLAIMLEANEFRKAGMIGNGVLRDQAGELINHLGIADLKFDASWLKIMGEGCFRHEALKVVEARLKQDQNPEQEEPARDEDDPSLGM